MLLLTLALGWAIFVYATRLGGLWGGLICLAVYVSAPVFLAFGPLVLTDIPIALFSVLTIWAFANLWRSPQRAHLWIFVLCLSAAFLSKFSAAILLLGLLTSGLTTRWLPLYDQPVDKVERRAWRRLRWRATAKRLLWTVLLVYAFYLVLSWNEPTDSLQRIGSSVPALVLRRLLLPLVTYLGGMFLVLFTFSRATFLLGHAYRQGVWFYYPVVVALKSQLGFLGLLVMTLVLALAPKRSRPTIGAAIPSELRMHWRTVWVTLVVFAGVCILSHFDISVRHFSVPLALLILMLAPLPRMLEQTAGERRKLFYAGSAVTAALVLSCLLTAVRAYPWYLPYVNALGAGKPVYTLMSDSNVDWNQVLPEVKQFAERRNLKDLPLDSYGMFDDTLFVPQSRAWDCQAPTQRDAGQWVVVSANMILDAANCSWLMRYPHEELAGGGMYGIHLPKEIPPEGSPAGPPRLAERRWFLGAPFDIKAVMLQVSRHPETIPDVIKQMQPKPRAAQ
jgi:hypothetical protein